MKTSDRVQIWLGGGAKNRILGRIRICRSSKIGLSVFLGFYIKKKIKVQPLLNSKMLDSKSVQLNYCVETALDDIYNILHSKDDKAIFNF